MRLPRRPAPTLVPTTLLLSVLSVVLSGLLLPSPAAQARVAPYEPVDPPVVRQDRTGDTRVFDSRLAKTDLTRRQARAADLVRSRFDAVEHDGERSAQVSVTFRRLAGGRPDLEQRAEVYFDEETLIELVPRADEAAYLSSYGGRATTQPGCSRLDSRTTGTTVTTWLPVRCLLDDSSEMTVDTTVLGTRTGREPGTRGSWVVVGVDGSYPAVPFIRWR